MPLKRKIKALREAWTIRDMAELATQDGLARAKAYDRWFDSGLIRTRWTNMSERAPGLWRSNQPTPDRLDGLSDLGIRCILSLRGNENPVLAHRNAVAAEVLGIEVRTAKLYARKPASKEQLLDAIAQMKTAPTPLLIHCKSGADRAGLGTALYRMIMLGHPVHEAREELSARFAHFRKTITGVLDHILDLYEVEAEGRDFETWVQEAYDPARIQASFDALPWWKR